MSARRYRIRATGRRRRAESTASRRRAHAPGGGTVETDGGPSVLSRRRRLWTGYARLVVRLRWVVVLLWVLLAVGAGLFLAPPSGSSGDLSAFVSGDSEAVEAEQRSFEHFGFPLLSRTMIVQRDPDGLDANSQAAAVRRGAALTRGELEEQTRLLGALPVPNTLGLVPGSRESGTTVVTYVFGPPEMTLGELTSSAEQFASDVLGPDDGYAGVTGSIPGRVEQGEIILDHIPIVEVVTVAVILMIVALTFRAVVAPIVTGVTAGAAVFLALRVIDQIGAWLDFTVPQDLQPLIVALVLGVVTDYCIFFLSGMRLRLAEGLDRRTAAIESSARVAPIVLVAGVTVAAGTAALVVAESGLFQGVGPALAAAVLAGLLVSVSFIPGMMAILGNRLFWPANRTLIEARKERRRFGRLRRSNEALLRSRSWLAAVVTDKAGAAAVLVVTVSVLVLMAWPLLRIDLGVGFISSLPDDNRIAIAADEAEQGFAPGVLAPTELLLEGDGLDGRRDELQVLEQLIEDQQGVAAVVGPGDLPRDIPVEDPTQLPENLPVDASDGTIDLEEEFHIFLADDGLAARLLLLWDTSPLDGEALNSLAGVRAAMPALLDSAGLGDVTASFAGDTALAEEVVNRTSEDLRRIGVAALAVNLLLLVLFLRALVAPLYLLACSVLSLAASLGLTVFVFQTLLGHDGLTFYVPFAAAVLLVALGSDYNIFAVGHVWDMARERPLPEAIRTSIPQSTRAIMSAGVVLAASFGLLAIVPLAAFRELAFAMAVGIMLDVLMVRSLLVPSLLTLVGKASGWPFARLQDERPRGVAPTAAEQSVI